MKALLLKDFLTLSKMIRSIVIIMLILTCVPQLNMTVFFMVYCSMLPVTALGYDERTKWDMQAAMMPYRPWEIVVGKYTLGYILLVAATALALLVGTIVTRITGSPMTADQYLTVVIYAMATTVFQAVTLPLAFRFGTEKGRLIFGIGFGVAFGVLFALVPLLNDNMDAIMLTRGQIAALILALAVLINLISVRLSIHFYRKKMA